MIAKNKRTLKTLLKIAISIGFALFLSPNAIAAIYYDYTFDTIVIKDEPTVDISDINSAINNRNIVNNLGDGIWLIDGAIYSDNSTVYINETLVSELRLTGNSAKSKILYGYDSSDIFRIKNITITGWDKNINEAKIAGGIQLHNSEFHDVNVKYSTAIQLYDDVIGDISNITISYSRDFWLDNLKDVEVYNIHIFEGNPTSAGAFYTLNCDNLLIHDVKIENISNLNGVFFKNMRNSEFYNFSVSHVGSYLDPKTGYLGISLSAGFNNSGHDIFINDTGWSGFGASAMEDSSTFKNIIVKNSGHNGIDIHPAKNILMESVKIYDSISNNVIVTAGYQSSPAAQNIHFRDFYLENGGAQFSDNVTNITFEDVLIKDGSFKSFGTQNVKCINITMVHGSDYKNFDEYFLYTKIGAYNVQDGTIIDGSFYRFGTYYTDNPKAINTKYQLLSYKNNLLEYYYPDFKLVSNDNIIISGERLVISNEVDKSITSVDGYGDPATTFPLDSIGSTYLPVNNRSRTPAMGIGKYDSTGLFTSFSHSAVISTSIGESVTLSDISPDSSWYREDPNIPTYTITAILPDEGTTGPQITGFAPSEDNPFTAGASSKFQVWSDEELTSMKWYVNGNLRSSGSMVYSWEVEYGTNTIMFTGSNANGNVLQIWEVTEGEEVPVESPVSSGTGLSFTPSATSLTANTGDSTTFAVDSGQEFTSALWYLDGSLVESGVVSHVEDWDTTGTHTVRFDGSAAAGTISRTWTAVISEPVESVYSSISISPSTTTVAPGESFSLDVYIDPSQSLTGSQFDLHYSQLASVSSVNEGGLFSPDLFATTFEYDGIDNAFGILSHVYSAIVGSGSISEAGVMATVDMVAGSESGVLELELANVVLSDVSSNPAAYTASYATVLVDTAPEFTSITTKSVEEGQRLSFTASATDADGDPLTYTATSLPSGASFDAGTATFSWTPSEGNAGSYEAVFEVTDGYLTDTVSVSITVTPLNHAPVITLFEPADGWVFEEGSTINVNVSASDEDGQSLSYIIKIDGSQVSTTSGYTWETGYESAGTHTIEVTVSDGIDEVSSSGTITITDLQPRWDVNEDGIVNVLDITLIGQNYGMTYTDDLPRWDVNQDATVNIQDLSIVAGHFGDTV